MRLTPEQAIIIKNASQQIYGAGTEVFLFGSRVDDSLKGGDIDLYVVPESNNNELQQRLQLHAVLQQQLGEQSIDIIIATDPTRLIEQQAIATGVKL